MEERKIILSNYTFPDTPSTDGYYHIYVTDVTKKSGRKQIKAKTIEELKDKVYCHELGISGVARKTFYDVFQLVQEETLRYTTNKEKLLSVQNTIGRNRSEYKRFFSGTDFEKKFIDEITTKDIEKIILCNLSEKQLTKKAFASMRSILNSVFKLAFNEYWIKENPYLHINFKKFLNMTKERVSSEERAFKDSDLELFLKYIHKYQEQRPFYIPSYALELQILVGLRRGEVPPLMWNDVKSDRILIHREQLTVKKHGNVPEHCEIVCHTKTYKDRFYPLTDELKEFFERLKKVHKRYYPDSKYLFPAETPNGVITNNTVYNFYRRMLKKLGYKVDKEKIMGTHSFRRNAITTVLNNSNGDLVMTSLLFGNSPDVIREFYYTGLDINNAFAVLNSKK